MKIFLEQHKGKYAERDIEVTTREHRGEFVSSFTINPPLIGAGSDRVYCEEQFKTIQESRESCLKEARQYIDQDNDARKASAQSASDK
jgi:hypothetical protein